MCGIVGYIGGGDGIRNVLEGLKELEYRGYDSSGLVAMDDKKNAMIDKQVGRVSRLEKEVLKDKKKYPLVIGHTRWATHGKPTVLNAHPHYNKDKTIFVVHNGIIENYLEIKQQLIKNGYEFVSETDTEVVPHLIDYYYKKTSDMKKAFEMALRDLQGAYAIEMVSTYSPNTIYLARLGSPMVIGNKNKEYFIASDPNALISQTKKVKFLEDYDMAIISPKGLKIKNLKKNINSVPEFELLEYSSEDSSLGYFPNYMLKEIFEIPKVLETALKGRINPTKGTVKLGGLDAVIKQLEHIDRIIIVACGTSYYAGLVGEYLIEEIANIPTEVQLASEFKYRNEPISRSTVVIAVSQSGETADTIAALKKVEEYGVLRLGVVNAIGSTIARMTDAGVYCHAGPEKAVASTKAFVAQTTVLALIALRLSKSKKALNSKVIKELAELPDLVDKVLEKSDDIKRLAEKYKDYKDFLFIGRGYNYPSALEGSLKLKELSYIHAEGYAAGEMKHGPLAMIDENFPTFAIATKSKLEDKVLSNIEEIKARKGPVLAIATKGDKKIGKLVNDVFFVPDTIDQLQPILVCVALQLFSYHVAVALGKDVDKPRNLAKSVTVE